MRHTGVRDTRATLVADWSNLFKSLALFIIIAPVGLWLFTFVTAEPQPPTMQEIEDALWWSQFWGWILYGTLIAAAILVAGLLTIFLFWVLGKAVQFWRSRNFILPNRRGDRPLIGVSHSTVGHHGQVTKHQAYFNAESGDTVDIALGGTVEAKTLPADPVTAAGFQQASQRSHQVAKVELEQRQAFLSSKSPTCSGRDSKGRGPNRNEILVAGGWVDEKVEGERLNNELKRQRLTNHVLANHSPKMLGAKPEKVQWAYMDFADAYRYHAHGQDAVAIGQNQNYGNIALWHYENDPSIRILGSPGSGKSVMQRTLIYQLAGQKNNVIIMGQKIDFEAFGGVCQLVDTDQPGLFLETVKQLFDVEYRNRLNLCMEHISPGAPERKYSALPEDVRPPRIFVVIDEFTSQINRIETESAREAERIVYYVEEIAANGRKTGLHLILGDQIANVAESQWSSRIKGTVARAMCGFISKGAGGRAAFGSELPSRANKENNEMAWNAATADEPDGQIIKGWHIGDLVQAMYEKTCNRTMPICVDLGTAVQRNETKAQIAEDDTLTPGVRKVVDALLSQGFTNVDDIPTTETAKKMGVSVGTMKRAKQYLRSGSMVDLR